MKLSAWAKKQGITYLTAYRWFRHGKLPVAAKQTETGTILVDDEPLSKSVDTRTLIYSRVSSHNKKDDLDRQVKRCEEFCGARGYTIDKVVKEVGSGMNDSRRGLNKILAKPPALLVVEHKDRLTRFGFNYLEILLGKLGCQVIVINRDSEEKADLIKDLVAIITSFCCRLYGLRRGKKISRNIKDKLNVTT